MVWVGAPARELGAKSAALMEASWVAATVTAYADCPLALLVEAQVALEAAPVEAALAPSKEDALAAEPVPPFVVLPVAAPLVLEVPSLASSATPGESVVTLLRTHSATDPHRIGLCSWLQPKRLPLIVLEVSSSWNLCRCHQGLLPWLPFRL
jgi:hypothetical protein